MRSQVCHLGGRADLHEPRRDNPVQVIREWSRLVRALELPRDLHQSSLAGQAAEGTHAAVDVPEEHRDDSRELDSSNSSDALLMNLFCFPGFTELPWVSALLGSVPGTLPEFGVPGQVPLDVAGTVDATEVDMRLGNVIVESKLTEADFTSRPKSVLAGYRDFGSVFHVDHLPQTSDKYHSYQLLRNILCAAAYGYGFALLCDGRRPDLIRAWWSTARCVRDVERHSRLRLVFWQELAAGAQPLREFLQLKYGL